MNLLEMKAKIIRLCGITIKGFLGMEFKKEMIFIKEMNGIFWNGLLFQCMQFKACLSQQQEPYTLVWCIICLNI